MARLSVFLNRQEKGFHGRFNILKCILKKGYSYGRITMYTLQELNQYSFWNLMAG